MSLHNPHNVLVTGGAGFIGANFVEYLLETDSAVNVITLDSLTYAGSLDNLRMVMSNPRHQFVKGDITDASLVNRLINEKAVDTIVHFAAESHVDRSITGPAAFITTNVVGTFTLLEAARTAWLGNGQRGDVRFHHVSTDEVFGSLSESDPPFSEATPYSPNSPYSASKAGSDHLVRAYHHTYGLPVTITNCSNNYGPYQHVRTPSVRRASSSRAVLSMLRSVYILSADATSTGTARLGRLTLTGLASSTGVVESLHATITAITAADNIALI